VLKINKYIFFFNAKIRCVLDKSTIIFFFCVRTHVVEKPVDNSHNAVAGSSCGGGPINVYIYIIIYIHSDKEKKL